MGKCEQSSSGAAEDKELLQLIQQFFFGQFKMAGNFHQYGIECSNTEILVLRNCNVVSTFIGSSRQALVATRLASLHITEPAELAGKVVAAHVPR